MPAAVAHGVLAAFVAWSSGHGAEARASSNPQSNSDVVVASFDCAHATSLRERAICGDPALSALDGQLGHLYRERLALLSPQGGHLLQESERSWLRFIGIVCASDGPETKAWLRRKFCLTLQYNQRIKQLEKAAEKLGPYVFNRIDLFWAQPSGDETGSATGFYIRHAAYPRIDNATSPELRAWNQANIRDLPKEGVCGPGDYDVDYEVGYANARIVSVQWSDSTYCHGTPHGIWSVKSNNTVLSPRLRPLTPQDLFGSGETWTSTIRERFWTALTQAGWKPLDNQPNFKRQIEDDFVHPDRWLFTRDGLQVAFEAYEGGCYACTPRPVTVPWSELKPLLSKTAIAP